MFSRKRKGDAVPDRAPPALVHACGPYRFGHVSLPVRVCRECGDVDLFFDSSKYMSYGNVNRQPLVPPARQRFITWDEAEPPLDAKKPPPKSTHAEA